MDLERILGDIIPKEIDFSLYYIENEKTDILKIETKDLDLQITYHKVERNPTYELQGFYESTHERYYTFGRDYGSERMMSLMDFTNRVDKIINKLPINIMGGILGFTYLFDNHMTIRDDLFGRRKLEVEVHEAIHTTDEYETRRLHEWMLDFKKPKYIQ